MKYLIILASLFLLTNCSLSPKKNYSYIDLQAEITEQDLVNHVYYLASPELKGRMTGSAQEKIYTQKISQFFKQMGLKKINNSYMQEFPFVAESKLGKGNYLRLRQGKKSNFLKLGSDWTPLNSSANKKISMTQVVFAGFGIVAPKTKKLKAYNSYKHLDPKGKWVLIYSGLPGTATDQERIHYHRYAHRMHKIMMARNRGAIGVIFTPSPDQQKQIELLAFKPKSSSHRSALPVISLSSKIAKALLPQLKSPHGTKISIKSSTQVTQVKSSGRNVMGLLKVPGAKHTVVVGAHGDHLGDNPIEGSLAHNEEHSTIHYGADDNASGVAAVLEAAHKLSSHSNGLKKNILFAVWSGEEIGILGSQHFTKNNNLKISSYINLDMVGRYKDKLAIQGIGSSSDWKSLIAKTDSYGLNITTTEDPYLPTDAMVFYLNRTPVAHLFTGSHKDYHSPRDTADKINFSKLQKITQFTTDLTKNLASDIKTLKYVKVKNSNKKARKGFNIFVGTIPDYSSKNAKNVKGLKLSGVIADSPAEKAGLKRNDIIISFGSKKIENIYDYVYSLQALRPNKKTKMIILRSGKKLELTVIPLPKS